MQRTLWRRFPSSSRNKFETTFNHHVSSEIFELTKNSFWEKSQDGKIFKTSFGQHLDNFSSQDLNFFLPNRHFENFHRPTLTRFPDTWIFFEDSLPLGKFHRFRIILQPLFIIEFENIFIQCLFWRSTSKNIFQDYEFLLGEKPSRNHRWSFRDYCKKESIRSKYTNWAAMKGRKSSFKRQWKLFSTYSTATKKPTMKEIASSVFLLAS